ncbi:hypothetical protein [Paractinoplanes rishiriensis]|uniref:Uncharacterized protein n=1 Tax=Paractinoplanes rishiriensis TaxID=1050105 RepID=A0A919K1A3_9ACTN|nr:hypothetical protein [Actinoplanes rishiriensis]GIE99061.1 hypothetical protein Ari01nite_65260 [Actinoplanes rishiriensis]
MFADNSTPTPPEWWDPRPATVRYHRPGWRVFVFLLVVICGNVMLWAGYSVETVLLALAGVGLVAATLASSVADGRQLPALSWPFRVGGAE